MESFELYEGDTYLGWESVVSWCQAAARAHPDWLRCETYGTSREGRPLLLLTLSLGGGDPRARSAFWLDGGTHASEWAGVMGCLFTVSRWLEALGRGDAELTRFLFSHTVYVAPCLSPDGFDHMMRGGPFLRSTRRPAMEGALRRGFEVMDVNADGEILWMRWRHPAGPWVQDEALPMLLRPRRVTDAPEQAFFAAPEGALLEEGAGGWVMAPGPFSLDLNRNFAVHWAPFFQFGMDGGEFALSEPEALAVTRAVHDRPGICAAVTNHTYTGALLTAPYRPDSPLSNWDKETLHRIATEAVQGTSYRVLKVWPEFQYEDGKTTPGVWADYLVSNRGIPAYTLELWDPYGHAGIELKDPARTFFRPDLDALRKVTEVFARDPRCWEAWRPFHHPQLGEVELGGLRTLTTVRNPPPSLLREELLRAFKVADTIRRMVPEPHLSVQIEPVAPGLRKVRAQVENRGYLSTCGLGHAERSNFTPLPVLTLELPEGARALLGETRATLPHLAGWGDAPSTFRRHPWNPVLGNQAFHYTREWLVEGEGALHVCWSHPRSGTLRRGAS